MGERYLNITDYEEVRRAARRVLSKCGGAVIEVRVRNNIRRANRQEEADRDPGGEVRAREGG